MATIYFSYATGGTPVVRIALTASEQGAHVLLLILHIMGVVALRLHHGARGN